MDRTVATDRAEHVDGKWRRLIETVERGMAAGEGLAYLAHFTDGIYNFGTAPAAAATGDEGREEGPRRDRYRRIGRQLNLVHEAADGWTRPLDSGRLIRTVLASDQGAMLHFTLRPHEYLVGVARGAGRIEAADRQAALITGDVRNLHGLGSENPGGYEAFAARVAPPDPPSASTLRTRVAPGRDGHRYADVHERYVCGTDLHYLACFTGGEPLGEVDAFEDEQVAHFFAAITPAARRRLYIGIVPRLDVLVRRLGFQLRALLDGPLTRIVLDVEEGALYYRILPGGVTVLGVTLDQSKVWDAEQRLEKAVAEQLGR
ncbi:hypothetical protein [Actinomadura roseirufa]|uniref:hypothetical protein n=1 Tax=Actinomadura roseirufa TaxID=2094049 RepID=UPI0010412E7B|nr:hypothetical protein [Actinomadura roseirufa]